MAGHTIRWQGAGFVDVYPEPESKNPDNLLQSWRTEKINGALINCIERVALCREYRFMLRKVQDLLCSLLPRNISAGSGD
ncbi:RepA leader peptide Tap [Klebsiella pneumoniae]|nr:RepA leader peptide Tap [Raoultella ornithinolytica]ATM68678.1 RepA leader peptide Tap [Klebsiella pneumoniae]NGX81769.1 RepA leader peptide Tap [Klebsiella pneumoniae subsp. pneumoniae]OVU15158.1 RepA leader peptide Tap [Klebsiella quasipneumoniae subsp. similipneumoniae]OWK76020.1 RepA leader peptide Tap [Klebsiella quasipneumoniae]